MIDITTLLTASNLALCLAISAITYALKTVLAYLAEAGPKPVESFLSGKLYNEVVLRLLPLAIGMAMTQQWVLGLCLGLLSSTVYAAVKGMLKADGNGDSNP